MIDSGHPVLVLALVCDQCGERSTPATFVEAWRSDAERDLKGAAQLAGWAVTDHRHLCPRCKPKTPQGTRIWRPTR